MRERRAVERALGVLRERSGDAFLGALPFNWEGSIVFAAKLFPLPTITRPRVVTDPSGAIMWKVEGGEIVGLCLPSMHSGEPKYSKVCCPPTPARVELWAALLASPTELVDEPDPGVSS